MAIRTLWLNERNRKLAYRCSSRIGPLAFRAHLFSSCFRCRFSPWESSTVEGEGITSICKSSQQHFFFGVQTKSHETMFENTVIDDRSVVCHERFFNFFSIQAGGPNEETGPISRSPFLNLGPRTPEGAQFHLYAHTCEIESACPVLILHGTTWMHFVDNDAALSALDGAIINTTWTSITELHIHAWFERVASKSEPTDGLSHRLLRHFFWKVWLNAVPELKVA